MKFLISIGQLNINIIYPIVAGILKFIAKYIINNKSLNINLSDHPLIMSIASSFGMSFSFILLIIYRKKNKMSEDTKIDIPMQDNKDTRKNSFHFIYIYNDQLDIINYDKYKYILLTSIMDFITTIINFKFCYDIQINMWIFDILFLSLFSYLIIQMKIYRHHYISIILIILAGIGLNIIIIIKLFNSSIKKIIHILIKFLHEIACSLLYVLVKFTMEKKFSSPFAMCFYQGFICLVLYLLYLPINIFVKLDDLQQFKEDFNLNDLFSIMTFVIIQFGYNIFFFITIKNCTTCHIMIIIIIGELSQYIIDKEKLGNIYFTIIICLLIFILFMSLIFNEILEINCCEMEKNTKKNIAIRSRTESTIDLYGDDDEDEDEDNEEKERNQDLDKIILNNKDEEKEEEESNINE